MLRFLIVHTAGAIFFAERFFVWNFLR